MGAVLVAVLTAQGLMTVGGASLGGRLPVLYVLCALAAVFMPRAILLQVVLGQGMLATLIGGPGGVSWLVLLVALAGVVLTAELLGVASRIAGAVVREPAADLRRVGTATAVAALVLGSVLVTTRLPGPDGLVAIVIAAVALVGAALLLVGDARDLSPFRR